MGTVAAVQHALNYESLAENMFINKELEDCAKAFVLVQESRADFTRFLKDGYWIDYLFQTQLLHSRSKHEKLKTFHCSLPAIVVRKHRGSLCLLSSITGTSSQDSRSGSRDSQHTDIIEIFSELYANVEGRTCFAHDKMQAFLFSIICPLYLENCKDFEMLLQGEESVENDMPCELGHQEQEMHRLQDILLGSAAYFDEFEVANVLSSTRWLQTINAALQDCELPIIIFRVDITAGSKVFTPVLINTTARRRDSKSSIKILPEKEQNQFCQLWGIEVEERTSSEMSHCLQTAQPMRIVSTGDDNSRGKTVAPSVLEVSHIFDDSEAHRYVLGMQMSLTEAPCPGSSTSATLEKELRYLSDSALLVAHLLKPSASATGSGRIVKLMRAKSMR